MGKGRSCVESVEDVKIYLSVCLLSITLLVLEQRISDEAREVK